MMRRGTLADHDLSSVLRQAAAERLSGQIDIDGDRPAVLYLADGELSLACWADEDVHIGVDDDSDDATYSAAILTEERRLRAATRDVLGQVLGRDQGWYHHHPLGEHRAAALWGWPVEEVLAEVAVRTKRPTPEPSPLSVDEGGGGFSTAHAAIERTSASSEGSISPAQPEGIAPAAHRARDGAPPAPAPSPPVAHRAAVEDIAAHRPPLPTSSGSAADREPWTATEVAAVTAPGLAEAPDAPPSSPTWRLAPRAPTEPLDEAAWSVVVALAGRASESELAARLGWPEVKADIVLRSLASRGVIVSDGAEASSA